MENQLVPASVQVEKDEKTFAVVGYFAFLFIISLIVKPQSKYCLYHAKQSMVMFIMTIIVLVFLAGFPGIGSLLTMALFAMYVLAIYKAYSGEMWSIPLVSVIASRINVDMIFSSAGVAAAGISTLKEKAQDLANDASKTAQNLAKHDEEKPTPPPEASK